MRLRLGLTLILMLLASAPRADPACETIAALERLAQAAQSADPRRIEQALLRLDSARVGWNLRHHPLARHQPEIDAALDLVAMAQGAAGIARMRSPGGAAILARLEAQIARHACDHDATGAGAGTEGSAAQTVSWRMPQLARAGLMALVLVGGSAGTARLLVAHRRRGRRQAQRHVVNLPVRLQHEGFECEARLLDISRLGAKLRVDADDLPDDLDRMMLRMGEREIEAALRWRNAHYLGVQFLKPLSAETMTPLVQRGHGRVWC